MVISVLANLCLCFFLMLVVSRLVHSFLFVFAVCELHCFIDIDPERIEVGRFSRSSLRYADIFPDMQWLIV